MIFTLEVAQKLSQEAVACATQQFLGISIYTLLPLSIKMVQITHSANKQNI